MRGAGHNGQHVYYIGANQHVYELFWTSANGWSNGDLTANHGNIPTAVGSSLTAFSDSVGQHVFYLGTNQHVYQLYWNSTNGWSNSDLTANTGNTLAAAGTALTSFGDSTGEHLFYFGTNNHVYQLYWNTTSWNNSDLTANHGNISAAPGSSLASFVDNQGEHVLYQGNNQHTYHFYWNSNNGWSVADLTNNANAPNPAVVAAAGSKLAGFAVP